MRKALLLLILMSLSLTVSAQEDVTLSDFMRAMAITPNMPQNGYLFSYADYHAAIHLAGMDVPESWAAWESDGTPREVLFALPQSGPSNLLQYIMLSGPEFETNTGVDFFHIAQGVEIGMPPQMGVILLGDFTADAVKAAYAAQDYTEEDTFGDATLLCPPDGCDTGLNTNPRERSNHPFGGYLGRKEPVIAADGILLNAPVLAVAGTLGATYAEQADSLAAQPAIQALDAALAAYPSVYSVTAYEGVTFGMIDVFSMSMLDAATLESIEAQLADTPLPPYSVYAVAGASDSEHNYGLGMLVYADAESAATAAASIDTRLAELPSVRTGQPFATIFGQPGTLEPATVFADDASGLYVVTVRIVADWPEEITVGAIAIPYRRLYDSLIMRDTLWLTWSVGE